LKLKALESSKSGKQAVHGYLRDVDIEEPELLQPREEKHKRGINLGEIVGGEAGKSQRGREAERRWRQRAPPLSSSENDLLEVI
jgi:hypothetical protein